MRKIAHFARVAACKTWWWLRQVTGDAAYENYLRSASGASEAARLEQQGAILTRQKFFLEVLERKYTGISRCC